MALLGARALIDLALPTGIDGAEILKFELQDGSSAASLVAFAASVIGATNESIRTQYGNMLYFTEQMWKTTVQGEAAGGRTPEKTEFVQADGVRTSEIGHMLPRKDFEDALSWTKLYMRRAYRSQLEADVQLIAERWLSRVRFDLFTRMLTNTENAIGSAGWDVPWAIGTGTNVNYIPPVYGATAFDSTHTHFVVSDDTSLDWDDHIEAMVTHLRHHGVTGRLSLLVSGSDLAEISALGANFVALNPSNVTVVAGNTGAPVRIASGEFEGLPGELFGYYQSVRGLVELRYDDYMPSNYSFMHKPYGINNPKNGLVIREEPGIGFGLRVDPQINRSMNPELEKVLFEGTHGVGVWERLNGVAGYIAAGASAWVNPTIS